MHSEWFKAFSGGYTPTVLRLKLEPHTLGHRILLEEFCPGFGEEDITIPRLLIASLICSHGYNAGRELLRSRWLPAFCRIWGWACRNLVFADEVAKFVRYEREAFWCPPINMPVGKGNQKAEAPFEVRKLSVAMSRLNMSLGELLDCPISRITALEYGLLEEEGAADFVPSEIQELIASRIA